MTHLCQYWYTGEGKSPIDNIIPTSRAKIESIIQRGMKPLDAQSGPESTLPETSIAPKNGGFQ